MSGRERGQDEEEAGEEAAEGRGTLAVIWEQVGTLILAVAIALGIRAFVIEPFRIPSGSMLPTLLIGDHLFVNKFIYGPRLPFTDLRLPGLRDPHRGDVVVFEVARGDGRRYNHDWIGPVDKNPELPRDDFVKRLVGLPGDKIAVRPGKVYVNGDLLRNESTGEIHTDEIGRDLRVSNEDLGECRHEVLDDPDAVGLTRMEFTVPEGRYFLMGDNRDHSNDSRQWGTVRLEEFKGPAFILYWSWNVNGSALQFFNPLNWWSADKRWDRVFQPVRCETAIAAGSDEQAEGKGDRVADL